MTVSAGGTALPRDFTLDMYEELCAALRQAGYVAHRITDYLRRAAGAGDERVVLLRHDVDRRPDRALAMARREKDAGLVATYFFRVRAGVLDPAVVRAVADLGHEVGYHYESVAQARGDLDRARVLFARDLARLRELAPVTTASMHGSPLLPWDNRALWSRVSPADFGLVGEVYRDLDYQAIHYVSDTGRTWHPTRFNVRDRLDVPPGEVVETTAELIDLVRAGRRPRLCILTHPERWSSSLVGWSLSAAKDTAGNVIKVALARAYGLLG
jgi:hypothetical protein